jgi:hypothetical protein
MTRAARRAFLGLAPVLAVMLAPAPVWPGSGGSDGRRFELYRSAVDAADPQNPSNEVIRTDTTAGSFGGVLRPLGFRVRIEDLTNQLSFKYFFIDRSCAGSSPRMALLIDVDGDGKTDDEVLGYTGAAPLFTGCPAGVWTFQDMCDGEARWDLRFFAGPTANTWAEVVAFFDANYPGHQVLAGALDDDGGLITGGPVPAAVGHAAYDLVTIGGATLESSKDTTRLNF